VLCHAALVRYAILFAAIPALVFTNCKASVQVNANSSASDQQQEMEVKTAAAPAVTSDPPKIAQTAFFGVARRLSIAPNQGEKTPTCSCLAVAVGNGTEPYFDWRGQASEVGYDAMAVAVSAEGVSCPKAGRGPSVRGFERRGDDVIIVVEEWQPSRPQAFGALVPNPGPQGHVYVRAVGKSPYGRPVGAGFGPRNSWCRVAAGTAFEGYTPNTAPPDDESESTHKSSGAYDEVSTGSTTSGAPVGGAPAVAAPPVAAPAGDSTSGK